ncbi:MAG TPA: M3 family metallopeptidase [Oligoflexia bacterium]|nr:M3 family metallopeptidase [Oligoflexia bacterium]HMR24545.1 M3 family metallopeptidase [Oligoflexia bacterium]
MENSPINFNLNAEQITQQCEKSLKKLEEALFAIENLRPETVNFENTFVALDQSLGDFADSYLPLIFFNSVSADKTLRDAAFACQQRIDQFYVDLYTREKLYTVLASFKDKISYLNLSAVDKRLVDKTLLAFERSGMKLNQHKRSRYNTLSKVLNELQSQFSKNIAEHSDQAEFTKSELDGLPESFLNQLEKNEDDKYIVTLAYPHYFSVMENAKNAATRKYLQEKFFKRGGEQNVTLFKKALRLRHILAKIMGYENHAAFILEERMAKTPDNVNQFLTDLGQKLQPKLKQELAVLLELKQKDLAQAEHLDDWDWRYYMNQLKKEKYQVDQEIIKEYFPTKTVIKGMFEIYQNLFNVEFNEIEDHSTWHNDAQLFSIREKNNSNILAYFYMDLYPRENKYPHAAAFTLKSGRLLPDGSYNKPVSAIVANFPKPSQDTPSLLPINQVETLFHEFGHIMHQTLTRAPYLTFSGTRVARDFVETPSQVLENWVWDEGMLNKFSGHYKNASETLPKDLLDKILASKLCDTGLHYCRQLMFATVDLNYHTSNGKIDPIQLWSSVQENIFKIAMPEDSLKVAGFGHLMGGYDSAYYGYLWAEVFAADLFTRFEKNGLLDQNTGLDYKKWILEKGGSEDAEILIEGFLQRPSNNNAFIQGLGL